MRPVDWTVVRTKKKVKVETWADGNSKVTGESENDCWNSTETKGKEGGAVGRKE